MSKKTNQSEGLKNFDMDKYIGGRSKVSEVTIPSSTDTEEIPTEIAKKTVSIKERKDSLLEYRETFLTVPKISDRKTVFISNDLRESIVDIVRKLGGEKSSVSGFIENLVRHHLEEYKEAVEKWKKL